MSNNVFSNDLQQTNQTTWETCLELTAVSYFLLVCNTDFEKEINTHNGRDDPAHSILRLSFMVSHSTLSEH